MSRTFAHAEHLTFIPNTIPDLSIVTNMYQMCYNSSSFSQNISAWNVLNVTNYFNFDYGTSASWTSDKKPNFN